MTNLYNDVQELQKARKINNKEMLALALHALLDATVNENTSENDAEAAIMDEFKRMTTPKPKVVKNEPVEVEEGWI